MSVLTEAQIIAQAQLLAQDTDPDVANQGLTVAQWLSLGNEAYYDIYGLLYSARVQYDSALVTAQVGVVAGLNLRNIQSALATWQDLLEVQVQSGALVTALSSGTVGTFILLADVAGGFVNIALGSVITGSANIPAGTTVLDRGLTGDTLRISAAIVTGNISGVNLTYTPSVAVQDANPPLERMAPEEIRWLQAKKGTTVVGAPTYCGYARQEGTGKFLLWFFPVPLLGLANYLAFGAYGRKFPTAMTGGAALVDLTDDESQALARLMAVRGSALLGDDELAAQVASQLPPKLQVLVGNLERYKVPRVEPSELTV